MIARPATRAHTAGTLITQPVTILEQSTTAAIAGATTAMLALIVSTTRAIAVSGAFRWMMAVAVLSANAAVIQPDIHSRGISVSIQMKIPALETGLSMIRAVVIVFKQATGPWPLGRTAVFPDMASAMQAAMVTGRQSMLQVRAPSILACATQSVVGREIGASIPTQSPATDAGRWTPSRVLAPADPNRALRFPTSELIAVSQIWKHAAGTAAFNETAPASARLDSAGSIANAQTARMALGVRSATQGMLQMLPQR